jgi:arylformamidase
VRTEPKLIDVSIPLRNGMPEWAGRRVLDLSIFSATPEQRSNVTLATLTTHTGTHVDAPRHFIHGGPTMDDVPLDRWVGSCFVADLRSASIRIDPADLDAADIPDGTERLVLKTRNSDLWSAQPNSFEESFVALSPAGAQWVLEHGIRLVGIDYLSIGPFGDDIVTVHRLLLGAGVIAVEGLDLSEVEPGRYELLCFPLKIAGSDGAPARVALRGPLA